MRRGLIVFLGAALLGGCSSDKPPQADSPKADPAKERRAAVVRLAGLAAAEAVPLLEKSAQDPDGGVRLQALSALGDYPGPLSGGAIERLEKAREWSGLERTALASAKVRVTADPKKRSAALSELLRIAEKSGDRMSRLEAFSRAMAIAPKEEGTLAFARGIVEQGFKAKGQGDSGMRGRAIEHLVRVDDPWLRKNFMSLCMSSDVGLRRAAMFAARLTKEDALRTGRRLVDEGLRKSYCAEMAPLAAERK